MVFRSIPALLAWAFEINAGYSGAISSLGKACGSSGSASSGGGLAALERKALAGQVVAWVTTLPLGERLVVLGSFNDSMQKQSVAYGLLGEVPSGYGLPAAQCAVLRWLDGDAGITKQMLAEKMGRSVRTADAYFNAVAKVLDALRSAACKRAAERYSDLLERGSPGVRSNKMVDSGHCALAI